MWNLQRPWQPVVKNRALWENPDLTIGQGDATVKDPIVTSDSCDEYDVLCNYPLGPNEAGHEYLKMVKQEWNSTQTIQVGDLDKLSVFKGDYDVVLYDADGNILEQEAIQVGDSCELRLELN